MTPAMTKIEQVARALCESDDANWDAKDARETANGCTPEEQRDYWRDKARAAIEAMRNPTMDMMKAARAHHEGEHYLPHSLFNSMIDAALNEQDQG